jgi:hypothetical protein
MLIYLTLYTLPGRFAVCRLPADAQLADWATRGPVTSVTRTAEEVSVVCLEAAVPDGVLCQKGWRGLRVRGPIPFETVGVLASLVGPLAEAGIGVFVVSTFDTDYVWVQDASLTAAQDAWTAHGHTVVR